MDAERSERVQALKGEREKERRQQTNKGETDEEEREQKGMESRERKGKCNVLYYRRGGRCCLLLDN